MSDDEMVRVVGDDGEVLAEWPLHRKPGPRPITCRQIKTSVRVLGERQVDEFEALCAILGRRPHQLAADMVLDAIQRYRNYSDIAPRVRQLVEARRAYQAVQRGEVIDLESRRR